jgi:dolichyl-phosphate beta-glucosyltransferase
VTRITFVLPSYNGIEVLPRSVEVLRKALSPDDVIMVVLNGPSDGSYDLLQEISRTFSSKDPELHVEQSSKGLGSALEHAINVYDSDFLVLSVDDLPFGLSDWLSASCVSEEVGLVTATKGHPDTIAANRAVYREIITVGFRLLRNLLLRNTVRDTQGTFFISGTWIRYFVDAYSQPGYMWTTALVTYAEQIGVGVKEVSAVVDSQHGVHSTRVSLKDYLYSFGELYRISRLKKTWLENGKNHHHRITTFRFPPPAT